MLNEKLVAKLADKWSDVPMRACIHINLHSIDPQQEQLGCQMAIYFYVREFATVGSEDLWICVLVYWPTKATDPQL